VHIVYILSKGKVRVTVVRAGATFRNISGSSRALYLYQGDWGKLSVSLPRFFLRLNGLLRAYELNVLRGIYTMIALLKLTTGMSCAGGRF